MAAMEQYSYEESMVRYGGVMRRPAAYTDLTMSRVDLLAVATILGLVMVGLWALLLLVTTPLNLAGGVGFFDSLGVTVFLYAVVLLPGFFFPTKKVNPESTLGAIITFARFKGELGKMDLVTMGVALVAAALLLLGGFQNIVDSDLYYHPSAATLVALMGMAAGSFFSTLFLARMRSLGVVSRGRTIHFHAWLKRILDGLPDDLPAEDNEMPETGASFSYSFPAAGKTEVGVVIPPEVMEKLRKLNLDADGRLFREDGFSGTLMVVQGQKDPVSGTGVLELKRLAAQFCRIAIAQSWTPMQFANEILYFVQKHIRYEKDDVSTQKILNIAISEYGRFPLETLVDAEGDCECSAILCAALLSFSGLPCLVIYTSNHAAVGLKGDSRLYPVLEFTEDASVYPKFDGRLVLYGETTSTGNGEYGFGTIPSSWREGFEVENFIEIPAFGEPS